ncbi:hypothetical protein RVF83_13285 [Gordonia rubripertincta]|uniref:Uncharacterized protein n=2 Tax=Gordonia rubripertincta TaxID=36822 RepID=A0AAW6R7F8_GORRU|nr:hypothetical protein [Gordonia rubripertincta]MDG6780310.1 hypothetical protein [Gordonia rubripertincta]NKY63597.1 hypothetical protein [Gordonia rubripertincta]GAB84313.1 hypothetical protein GORBP_039_00240 [Gordonia rubripertincta NBRC 101908]
MVDSIERNKDLMQELIESTATHVGRIATIITGAVAGVTREIGEIVTDGFEMREAARKAKADELARDGEWGIVDAEFAYAESIHDADLSEPFSESEQAREVTGVDMDEIPDRIDVGEQAGIDQEGEVSREAQLPNDGGATDQDEPDVDDPREIAAEEPRIAPDTDHL